MAVRGAMGILFVLALAGLATAVDSRYSGPGRGVGAAIFLLAMASLFGGTQRSARRRHEVVFGVVVGYGIVRLVQGHVVVLIGIGLAVAGIVLLERPAARHFYAPTA